MLTGKSLPKASVGPGNPVLGEVSWTIFLLIIALNLRWVRRSVIWNRVRLQKLLLYIKKSRFRYASDQHASCVRCFVHIQLEGGPRADTRERLCLLAGLGMPLCPPGRWLGSRRLGISAQTAHTFPC